MTRQYKSTPPRPRLHAAITALREAIIEGELAQTDVGTLQGVLDNLIDRKLRPGALTPRFILAPGTPLVSASALSERRRRARVLVPSM